MGVFIGLQFIMPTLFNISVAYFSCERRIPLDVFLPSISRKKFRSPRSFSAKSNFRSCNKAVVACCVELATIISSTYINTKMQLLTYRRTMMHLP
jgi:hypothetical protein